MGYMERDLQASHITDPAVTATAVGDLGNGADGASSTANFDKIEAGIDALIIDVAANNAAIDAILVALENVGIVAKA